MARYLLISQFAQLTGLPPKTLRYYDDIGLLCPQGTDQASGYRQYSVSQVSLAIHIRHWRQMGLPVSEIQRLIQTPEHTAAILGQHKARLQTEIAEREAALSSLHTFLKEKTMEYRLEQLPTQQVLVIRETLQPPHYEVIPQALQELMAYKHAQNYSVSAPSFFVHHAGGEGETSVVEVFLPVTGTVQPSGRIQVQTFEGGPAFIGRFVGPYEKTGAAYSVVAEEALRRGLKLTGSTAEIYVKSVPHTPDPNAYETDIAFFLEPDCLDKDTPLASQHE
ncbi:MerR family transcriptional regulator [Deinococcus radiophilus]|uniref:MerR family transcriptional regulator n=1 Tax=Deinococcus radiophilus TaxID=32062 RepID=A0A3S0JN04_9DEIO|nr:MerR family transcriptional regulator [Deinococcus radiophilus]RTR25410.1 MerR family transcriptional regulator [Deinococcus radiophilus]UFA50016.1 MerR family transcriptional regulator [Deinococcus radiophilus]